MAMKLRTTEASETYSILWAALTQVHGALAREMEDETGIPFERYRILLMLAQADTGALRPSELADALPITRSGVTRLIDRLERDGIVARRSCAADGRGKFVALTPQGEEVFRQAGRVHLRGIDHHLGSSLTTDELAQLRRLVGKLSVAINDEQTEEAHLEEQP